MSANIFNSFAAFWEKIMSAKILSTIITILAIYFLMTFFISIKDLNSSPDQLFLSKPIKPEIIELKSDAFYNLKNEIENIKSVFVLTNDNKVIYFLENANNFKTESNQTSLEETLLQYTSGSSLVYATNCANMIQYKHGACYGPGYYNGIYYSAQVCECIRRY